MEGIWDQLFGNMQNPPNAVNINLYEDGGQGLGFHADDESLFDGLNQDCRIISVSVGGATLVRALRVDEWAPPAGWRFGIGVTKEASTGLDRHFGEQLLDDVWLASHATPLNFVQGACRSAVVITTRMRSLLDGASEVQCNVLSAEASLELLLRAGGCKELLDSRPEAALEAVEYCGRLPLALGLAGGIIKELADSWQHALIPLLQEELGGEFDEALEHAKARAKDVKVILTVDDVGATYE